MKTMIIIASLILMELAAFGQPSKKEKASCDLGVIINKNYSKARAIDSILKRYTPALLPGVSLAIYSDAEGWWTATEGYAKLETRSPMDNCHLQYVQSVSKMYMAVEMLQLKEQGKINFDDPMTKYLPVKYSRYIKDAGKVTIRMLLNQTSACRNTTAIHILLRT